MISSPACLTGRRANRGIALIAVLWVISLLALLAAGIGGSARTVTRVAYNGIENAKARMAADAGVQRAIFDLLADGGRRYWAMGGGTNRMALDDAQVLIQVRDEDGKIDVNAAPIDLIEGVLRAVGVEETTAVSLASRIVDYRDRDSTPGPLGAEDQDYLAAGRLDGAADRPFRMVAELRQVLGMPDDIHARLRPHFTIYSDAEGVDPLRASAAVLQALPGMTPEALEIILSLPTTAPDEDPFLSLPPELTEPFEDYLLPSRELIYEILATGESAGGGRFTRSAIISLDGGQGDLPFTIYEWRRDLP